MMHANRLAPVPDWLVGRLKAPEPSRRPVAFNVDKAPAKIAGIVRAIAQADIGQRNSVCFWGACRLAELAQQQVITRGDAIDIVVEAASRTGLPHTEALRTAYSAFRVIK
jgi:hypothetical protein